MKSSRVCLHNGEIIEHKENRMIDYGVHKPRKSRDVPICSTYGSGLQLSVSQRDVPICFTYGSGLQLGVSQRM